jgi:DNA-binding transcriptional LysR family regulator
MNTRDIEAFLAVVETGSIVGASARLNLTQPGVTRRIQSLEQMLGTELLDRQSKPLRPTAAGREAYEQGRRLVGVIEDLRSGVSPQRAPTGEFRLGITPYLSEPSLAAPIDRVRREFDKLDIRINADWSPQLVERLGRGELDAAAICLADGVDPPVEFKADDLGAQPVLLVAGKGLAIKEPASLEDLAAHPWVMNQDGCGIRTAIKRIFEAARLPFRVGVEALSPDLRLSLIARGLGIGLETPAGLAASPLRDAVRIIDAPSLRPRVRAWLIHRPPAGRLALPIELFGKELRNALSERTGSSA